VLAEYVGPEASDEEQVSDLGARYSVESEIEWLERMLSGEHDSTTIDDPDLPEEERAHLEQFGAKSVLYIPLRVKGSLVGYAELWESRRRREFSPREIALCKDLARHTAIAIENARLHSETERRLQEQIALREASGVIASALDLETVLSRIAEQMSLTIDATSAYICVYNTEDMSARVIADFVAPHASSAERESDLGEEYSVASMTTWHQEMQAGRHHVSHADGPDLSEFERAHWPHYGVKSALYIPLRVKDHLLGSVELWETRRRREFTPDEVALCHDLAQHAAVALENARLYEQAQQEISERKRAEEALRESEELYRTLVSASPDAVLATNLEGRITYASQRSLELYRFDHEEELLGLDYLSLIADGQRNRAQENMWRTLEDGSVRDLEYTALRKDGSHFAAELSAALIGDGSGQPKGFIASTRDITERKQLEQQNEARRQYLENVLAFAPDAIVALDPQQRILEWNQGAVQLFGYSAEEAIGHDIDALVTAADASSRDEAIQFTRQVLNGRTLPLTETTRYRKDGTAVDVLVAGSPMVTEDGLVGVVAVYVDISKRMRTERFLQALNLAALAMQRALAPGDIFAAAGEELSRRGLASTVYLLDNSQSRLIPEYSSLLSEIDETARRLLGVASEGSSLKLDNSMACVQAVRGAKAVFVHEQDSLRQVLAEPRETSAMQVADPALPSTCIVAPLIVEDRVVGLLVVQSEDMVEDDTPIITALAHQMSAAWWKTRLLQDLEESLEALERTQAQFFLAQKMEAIGRLAGGVAHDFNNLLTVIQLSARLLEREIRPEDPLWDHVQRILDGGQRAATLTKQLLSFSRREIVKPQVLNLNSVVSDLSQMLQRIMGEDVELRTVLAEDVWPVRIDRAQLDQTAVNLAFNARDAMPEGGLLTIETSNVVLDEPYAAHHMDVKPGEYVMLALTDSGVGMDDEVQAHLFEPFFTTKEPGKGTGLGLASVFGIVKQNEGHIRVYSEPGLGTTFKLYLPRAKYEGEPVLDTEPQEVDSHVRATERILLVEDEPMLRDLAVQILRSRGYQVLVAQDGTEALQLSELDDGPIHLLLTDVVMPRMSGRELAEEVLRHRPDTKVMYMSGYTRDTRALQGVADESTAFLPKPFTVASLTKTVRDALDQTT
ncbi:PAS domain S-box protein, partial [Chloroflexota bacterium]